MALYQATQVKARKNALAAYEDGDVLCAVGEFIVPAGLAVNDVIEFAALPAGSIPLGCKIACEKLDTGGSPAIVLNAGILSGSYMSTDSSRTCGTDFISASNVGQAGGYAATNVATGLLSTPSVNDRGVGLKVATAASTLSVGARIRFFIDFVVTTYGIDAA